MQNRTICAYLYTHSTGWFEGSGGKKATRIHHQDGKLTTPSQVLDAQCKRQEEMDTTVPKSVVSMDGCLWAARFQEVVGFRGHCPRPSCRAIDNQDGNQSHVQQQAQ